MDVTRSKRKLPFYNFAYVVCVVYYLAPNKGEQQVGGKIKYLAVRLRIVLYSLLTAIKTKQTIHVGHA